MEEQLNVRMPPGTTECNHSYYTGNSFSAPHFVQQLQNGTIATPVQPLASIQEVNGAASSGFVSSSLLPRSAISSQVPAGPTRNVTGDVMPLAEAITQLSFLEFLQRCGVSIAPPQPSQLPVPISLLDAAVQTTPPCGASQDVSTQTSDQPVSSLSFDVAVQTSSHGVPPRLWMLPCRRSHTVLRLSTSLHRWVLAQLPRFLLIFLFRLPYAVLCYTMLPYSYRSRSSLLAVFSRTILWTAKTLFVSLRHQYKVHVPCCSHRQDSNSSPPFWSRYWFSLAHYTWRIYCSCTSTSSATFSYFSYASTAPCLYHPCGITSSTFSHYRQEKCQYRLGGNAQSC